MNHLVNIIEIKNVGGLSGWQRFALKYNVKYNYKLKNLKICKISNCYPIMKIIWSIIYNLLFIVIIKSFIKIKWSIKQFFNDFALNKTFQLVRCNDFNGKKWLISYRIVKKKIGSHIYPEYFLQICRGGVCYQASCERGRFTY